MTLADERPNVISKEALQQRLWPHTFVAEANLSNAATVSRCHARLVISDTGAMIEDLGSKNGTFVGAERVTAPTSLADGDAIRIGSLILSFHVRGAALTDTQTEAFS